MSDDDGFLLPGVLDPLHAANEADLHIAGLERYAVMFDPVDLFPGDPDLDVETPGMRDREERPQQGGPLIAPQKWELPEEERELQRKVEEALKRWEFRQLTIVIVASVQTTAAGGIDLATNPLILYEPPPGFSAGLHRLSVVNVGSTEGAPFTAAGSYWQIRVQNEPIYGQDMVGTPAGNPANRLPTYPSWGTRDAIRVRDGQVMSLFMASGPSNQKITCNAQFTLERTIEG
jgi:hypothetical protein